MVLVWYEKCSLIHSAATSYWSLKEFIVEYFNWDTGHTPPHYIKNQTYNILNISEMWLLTFLNKFVRLQNTRKVHGIWTKLAFLLATSNLIYFNDRSEKYLSVKHHRLRWYHYCLHQIRIYQYKKKHETFHLKLLLWHFIASSHAPIKTSIIIKCLPCNNNSSS